MSYISMIALDYLLTQRLDSEYYSPDYIDVEAKIKSLQFGFSPLSHLVTDIKDGPGGWGISTNDYKESGVPVIRGTNLKSGFVIFDPVVFISEKKHLELIGHEVLNGDVVLSVRGTVGRCAVFKSEKYEKANLNAAVVRMKCIRSKTHPYFLASFFNSKYGRSQSERISNGAVQQNMNLAETASNLIPTPNMGAQTYIGNKVRQAELLREGYVEIEHKLESEIQKVILGEAKPVGKVYTRQSVDVLTSNRLDPDFYSVASLWSEFEITHGPYHAYNLGELTTRIKDGPGGWGVSTNDYKPYGIPVIRSVNIVNGECDLTGCVYISEEKHQELIGHEAKKGSVVLSVRGTVGRAAVFDVDDVYSASLNAAVVTIDCKENLNPYYLAAFFNSSVGNKQANRIANGAVQLNMNLTETASNLIPLPPINVQEKVEKIYRKLILARIFSRMLLEASKSLVEALIEGHLTEKELIIAQQALENDDNSKDKAILEKLTDKGYGLTDGNPLFSDIDALYALLDEAQQAEESA